jgi:predicted nucleic acid-binding Zn ribbon protein
MSYLKAPNRLESLLDALYADLNFDAAAEEFKIVKTWSQVVGSHIARVSEIEKIVDGVLYVKVKNSAWRNELTFKRQSIMAQLNYKLQSPIIKGIVFK